MARPKNVLLILCDQLRADFLGAYGNTNGVTPHIDQLAGAGMVFDKAYSVMPVCTMHNDGGSGCSCRACARRAARRTWRCSNRHLPGQRD